MVFNTGAALLDAIVLAVVSKEPEGTYGYKITQDVRGVLDIQNPHFIQCCAACRRMTAWKFTIRHMPDEIADIIN